MAIVINGDGTVSGLSVGGLPDGTVDAGTLATNSVDSAELVDGAIDAAHLASGVGEVAGISSSADATAMTITSAEKIGIGTTSPDSIVEIEGASPILTITDTDASGDNFGLWIRELGSHGMPSDGTAYGAFLSYKMADNKFQIQMRNGSTTYDAITIDRATGAVIKPNQPAFAAGRNSGAVSSGVYICNVESFDIGNNHNTSNGRFTAPVSGKYWIGFTFMTSNGSGFSNKNIVIQINGTNYKKHYYSTAAGHAALNWSGLINLSANDYVTIYNTDVADIYGGNDLHSTFSGYLVS